MEETSTLFKLPLSILCILLSEWLTVDSICVFDTAVAEVESRKFLLESLFPCAEFILEDNSIGRNGLEEWKNQRDGHSFLYWMHKRRLCFKHVNLACWLNITDEGRTYPYINNMYIICVKYVYSMYTICVLCVYICSIHRHRSFAAPGISVVVN